MNSRISDRAQKVFWQTLNNDLDIVAQESTLLLEKQEATALSGAVAAVRAVIAHYQRLIASDEQSPG